MVVTTAVVVSLVKFPGWAEVAVLGLKVKSIMVLVTSSVGGHRVGVGVLFDTREEKVVTVVLGSALSKGTDQLEGSGFLLSRFLWLVVMGGFTEAFVGRVVSE